MVDWVWLIKDVIIFGLVTILAAIQLAQIIFPIFGLDKNRYYVTLMKSLRKLILNRKQFILKVKKSYTIDDNDYSITNLKKILKSNLSEFNPIIEGNNNYKLSARIKRGDFHIDITIYIHDHDDPWILIDQSMIVRFNKLKEALNTTFFNIQRFNNSKISPLSDQADVIIDAEELKLFKALFEEMGTYAIGDISMFQEGDHTFLKITDKPEIEFAKKVSDFVELGHIQL